MTTELTKAAQQALACMRGLQQHLGPDICAIEADAIERALTQRPAAQTEREAHEPNAKLMELADRIDHDQLWRMSGLAQMDLPQEKQDRVLAGVMLRRYADLLGNDGWRIFPPRPGVSFRASTLDKVVEMARRDEARRASLPTQPAAQATPVQDVGASADYWGDLAQQKADADARRGVSMPVSYYTSSIVGALLATQQATPEPVLFNGLTEAETNATASVSGLTATPPQQAAGEPVAVTSERELALLQKVGGLGTMFPPDTAGFHVKLYTHPAPGVPEDVQRNAARWEEVLRQVGADRQCGGFRFTLYNLRPIPGSNPMQGAVCQHFTQAVDAMLAAAQAKAVDPEDLAAAGVMLMGRRADHA